MIKQMTKKSIKVIIMIIMTLKRFQIFFPTKEFTAVVGFFLFLLTKSVNQELEEIGIIEENFSAFQKRILKTSFEDY